MSGANIALGLITAIAAWNIFRFRARLVIAHSFWVLLLFFLWAGAAACMAEKSFNVFAFKSFEKSWNYLPMFLIPAIFTFSSAQHRKTADVLFATAAFVVLLGLLQYYFGFRFFFQNWFQEEGLVFQGRFYGFQSHPLHSGALYCLSALCALSFLLYDDIRAERRLFLAAALLILALGVFLTKSRSYYLGLAAGAGLLLAFKSWKTLFIGALAAGILVIVVATIDSDFKDRVNTLRAGRMDDSAKIRLNLWKAAGKMIEDHPLAGVGYGKWKVNILDYSQEFPGWDLDKASFAHAHNSYLMIAAETGIPGLVLILTFWIFLLKEQFKNLRTRMNASPGRAWTFATIAGIAALLVGGFFEHNFLTATPALCLFFFVGLSRCPESPS